LLRHGAQVRIDALETEKRPVSAVADFTEVRDITRVEIREAPEISMVLLFDRDANLQERVFKEQFMT
jgi:NAD+ kinase